MVTKNIDGVEYEFDKEPTAQDIEEARAQMGAEPTVLGTPRSAATLTPTDEPGSERQSRGGSYPAGLGKFAMDVAPALAAARIPGAGWAAGGLRAGANAVGNIATGLLQGEKDPTGLGIRGAVGAVGSGAGDLTIGGMNKIQGNQQMMADIQRLVDMFKKLNGQDVEPTAAGMSNYLSPKSLPMGLAQRSGSELGSTMVQLGHLYGDPTVTIAGRNMPFSKGVELIQALGKRVDFAKQSQAGEATNTAELIYDAAKNDMAQSLKWMPQLLEAYTDANAKHAMNMGVRQMLTSPNAAAGGQRPFSTTGGYNAQAAQGNLLDSIETGMITRDTPTAEILRQGIRRGAEGWNSTDQPAQGLLSALRAYGSPSAGGISASVPGLAAMRFPTRIGDAVKVSPATAGLLQPGLPAGATALWQFLRNNGIDMESLLKDRE